MINRKGYREAGSYRGGKLQEEEEEDQPQKLKALLKIEKTKLFL